MKVFRGLSAAYWVAVLAIFSLAGMIRTTLPAYPFADPDTQGYLYPGFSALTGNGFSLTDGRSFPYPLFLYLIQRAFGGLDAIAVVQHAVGFGSGALLLWVWHRFAKFYTLSTATWIIHRVLGCVILFSYLMASFTVEMEHSLRPEAVFPFFAILAVGLAAQYCRLFYQKRNLGLAFVVGTVLAFDSALVYFLKPAWGFATVGVLAPVCVSLFQLKGRILYKIGIIVVPGLLAYFAFWAPEQRLIRAHDPLAARFLPAALFTYHAPMVRDEIVAELDRGGKLRYSKTFMESVVAMIDEQRKTGDARCFPSLGFNPELLMSNATFYGALEREFRGRYDAGAGFCRHYFLAAWCHQPGRMVSAVVTQMRIPNSSVWRGPYQGHDSELRIADYARQVQVSLSNTLVAKPYPPFERYLAFWKERRDSKDIWRQPKRVARIHEWLRKWYGRAVSFSLFFALGTTLYFRRKGIREAAPLGCAWWAVYLFSINFWNNLTIALTVSTEYNRYLWSQLSFTLLAEAWAILLACIAVSEVCRMGVASVTNRREKPCGGAEV